MCTNPQSVPNPLYTRRGYGSQHGKFVELSSDFSPSGAFIEVPCGKCAECRNTYFNSLLQRAICESRSSYIYFVTLTYDDKHIPFIDLDGDRILYADYKHIQDMIKRLRNLNLLDRDFRYFSVNEYGDLYSRPHFHIMFFVAKKDDDIAHTPYLIEKLLYDNLKNIFAENVGTRKHPQYEPLFTFCQRCTPLGLRANYWVKLVEPDSAYDHLKSEDESYIKAIRYLIGYVNSSNRIDESISSFLGRHAHDPILCAKVKRLLSNRVRFSKGFGCGFVNGEKFYLPKISVRASTNILTYSEIVDNLPNSADDFENQYPEQFEELLEWLATDKYRNYSSLKECMKDFTVDDYRLHCLTLRYFPKHFALHYRYIYKNEFVPTISALFNLLHPHDYSIKRVATTSPEDCDLYRFLRSGVEEGISAGVPFIAFPQKSQQGYCALCKYYRDRVCTFEDLRRMYDSIGVKNYDEWRERFIKSWNTRKADRAKGNEQKYRENSEVILQNQKKSLHLLHRKAPNIYFALFVL